MIKHGTGGHVICVYATIWDCNRWELALPQPPATSPQADPEPSIRIVATRDIAPGEQLLLCYSSGHSNDAMFLHYGFVPAGNTDDDVVLFDDTNAALNWHCQQYVVRVGPGCALQGSLIVVLRGQAHFGRVRTGGQRVSRKTAASTL